MEAFLINYVQSTFSYSDQLIWWHFLIQIVSKGVGYEEICHSFDGRLFSLDGQDGPGLHHVAYLVEDLSATLAALKAAGVRLIDETPRTGAHGMKIAFAHPKSTGGVLTEFCEPR